jgi:hypothetical protein
MRTTGGMAVFVALALLVLAGARSATGLSAGAAGIPQPVSPGARTVGARVEARCPTFSWAGVEGADGYELAIFSVAQAPDAEPVLVTRTSLPERVQTWTPAIGQCLERGGRYAWSVATTRGRSDAESAFDWAPVLLFEVDSAPSSDDLEHAIATIQRHLATRGDRDAERDPASASRATEAKGIGRSEARRAAATAGERTRRVAARAQGIVPVLPSSSTSGIRTASAATTPTAGSASLTVTDQIHLGAASDLFKDGSVFLWDDDDGNSALGRNALASVSGEATNNTALGREALLNTTGSDGLFDPFLGSYNTALGDQALRANTTGYGNSASGAYALTSNTTGMLNTASGAHALVSNTTGERNTASGYFALAANEAGSTNTASGGYALYRNTDGSRNTATGYSALFANTTGNQNTGSGNYTLQRNSTGSRNTAIGYTAGYNTLGSDNILINNFGVFSDESNVLRIGQSTGTGSFQLAKAFIHGIRGGVDPGNDPVQVMIDQFGQLHTVPSTREVKQDVQDLGPLADRLLELRPVAFRLEQHVASDPATPLQFGLIAEEVAEVFPELVVYDATGKPQTVRYHLLSSLLLGELQRQHGEIRELQEQQGEIEDLRSRLAALESGSGRAKRSRGGGELGRGSR